MDDLRARFQTLDQVEVPDLWSDIASRTTSQTTVVQRARSERPVTSAKRVNPLLVAIVATAAILVLALGGVFVGSRLGPIDSTPSPETSQPPSTPSAESTRYGLVYELDGDLFIADWDGTDPTVIAQGGSEAECRGVYIDPGRDNGLVSPDGRYLAYRSSCRSEVVITDPNGRQVTSVPGYGWNVAWSPDSTRIATWLSDSGPNSSAEYLLREPRPIVVYGLDGALQATLDGERSCCGDYDPVFSPDGASSILVRENLFGVWELPLDGGAPRIVPAADPRSTMRSGLKPLAYAPDKSRVAFLEADGIGNRELVLVVADPDGAERQVLIERDPGHLLNAPMWSPVDDRIVFTDANVTFRQNASVDLESVDLRVADVRTGVVSTLFTRVSGSLEALDFSPDGERILVRAENDGENASSLWSVATDGSGAQLLVEGTSVGAWVTMPANPEIP